MTKKIPFSVGIVATAIAFVFVAFLLNVARAERTTVSSGSGVMTTGICNTASSTLAYVQSPFGATSTVTFINIRGTNAASSTDILVATSTTSAPSGLSVATSTLAQNVAGLFNIPANKQFYSVAGVTIGSGAGYNSSSGGTYRSNIYTVVGPNEGILIFATSTNPVGNGGLSVGALGVPASCTYEINWLQ